MSQNEKRLFDRHKKQEEPPLEQTQAVPAVQDEITAEPAAEATPKRNKYADKMNRKKRRLSKVRVSALRRRQLRCCLAAASGLW